MSCRRASDIDREEFLAHPSAPEFADFRGHYPRCAVCAPEVRGWTEVDLALAQGEAPHPAPELLFRFAERRRELAAAERTSVERHLSTCASCRDEMTALGRFDFDALLAPAAPAAPASRRWSLPAFGRLVLHPAFAYALVLLLLVEALPPRRDERLEVARRRAPGLPATTPGSPPVDQGAERPTILGELSDRVLGGGERKDAARKQMAPRPAPPPELRRDADVASPSGAAPAEKESAQPSARTKRAPAAVEEYETGWMVVTLAPGATPEVSGIDVGEGISLNVPVPLPFRATRLEVRVLDADGRRELRERLSGPHGDAVRVPVPRSWLRPGTYRVELWAPDVQATPDAYALRVE